jgi:hypothetical protein
MAVKKGNRTSEDYNNAPVIPGNKKVWFLNGDLVRIHHYNKSNGIMSVYNINKDRIESCLINDFKNKRERAYTVGWQVRSYYSESQVRDIRDILATYHIGRPRKDNLITNDITPSKAELTRRMGDGILTYTKTEDGRFIPIWSESI